MRLLKLSLLGIFLFLVSLNFITLVLANNYSYSIYFNVPNTVYTINERIEIKGYLYSRNYSDNGTLVSNSLLSNANINLTIKNLTSYVSNYSFTTDSNGSFYSRSNYYTNTSIPQINASSVPGNYTIRAQYKDSSNITWYSQVEILVVNNTIDSFSVSSDKAVYNPSENMKVNVEAIRMIGNNILYMSNVSVSGTLRNSSKNILQSFSCTTGTNGKCSVSLTGPSSYGNYILELNNYKAFSSFSVIPFSYTLYVKDDLGKSMKNVFSSGEQGMIEVKVSNASDSDVYSFSGYITNSSGSSLKEITSTTLNLNNSFTNTFLFTISDVLANPGAYSTYVTVSKSGDGSISSSTSFEIKNLELAVEKKEVGSGFEYQYNSFSNKTLKFEIMPNYRSNGSIIPNQTTSSFSINLKDNLNNIITTATPVWNGTCRTSGCYQYNITSPLITGQYYLETIFSFNGETQTNTRVINVIEGVMSAQSVDKDGNIKELFGTNEYVYLSLTAYNSTSIGFNLTDAEVFIISYMNGSELSYSQASNFDSINSSAYKWAWNSSLQRIKLSVPKFGGIYNVHLLGNNRTIIGNTKFIINPYDVCSASKNTAGQITSGYYYVWQFKTSDSVYFELKLTEANNPLGKATALNSSTNSSTGNSSIYGMGSQCYVNTQTKQVVSNATITIAEIKNLESGAVQSFNATESTCSPSDNTGGYTCTVKPFSKWQAGQNIVKFNIIGKDGTTAISYSMFEARAFYLYGYSTIWQNNPSSNISLNLYMYEAGSGWWGGTGGVNGKVVVKKVEYQGKDGEWIWPPVDSGYNVSSLNSTTISSSSSYYVTNALTLPVSNTPGGQWKTGYYRVTLQGSRSTSSGEEIDHGYAWFNVKLWDVYGQPIECISNACNYKSYFNSKENITIYVKISKAGSNYNSNDNGGQNIYGNVSVGIKKISDCRKWPCKDLNSSDFTANTINVNASSPWYWNSNANLSAAGKYIIQINSTSGTWGTGYYNVILDINGTDTGYAWFNTIAFYVETQPSNSTGGYRYSIRGNSPMYFNVSTTKSYKYSYSGARYNQSDYVNTSFDDAVLRTWNSQTNSQTELNFPENINVTPRTINGTGIINITYLNGTWPSGYYWGELTLKNSANETSTGYLWFEARSFRVNIYANSYSVDADQCVNASLYVYDPDWGSSTLFYGNYSITSVYEDVWSGYGSSRTSYSNYSINNSNSNSTTFNATNVLTICPNSGSWGSGSWGGYHYLNIIVKDNSDNSTEQGWLSFRSVPFSVSWSGYIGSIRTNAVINTTVSLTKPSTGAATSGRLTKLYQYRYDSGYNGRQEYIFAVGNSTTGICYSNVSSYCTVTGTQTVTVYAPSTGWRTGWNYIQAEWQDNSGNAVSDWGSISFDGKEAYSGWFDNYWYDNGNYNYKYYIALNENITIKLNVRDSSNNPADVTITNVKYAYSGDSCWSEYCRSYTDVPGSDFSPTTTSSGGAVINIKVPSTNWTKGYYAVKADISGAGGTATITGGTVRAKDYNSPNLTITSPINNQTYNTSLIFNATTNENANCYLTIINYDNFYNWYCFNWNVTNSSNSTSNTVALEGACNISKYNYNGSTYYYENLYNNYHYISNNTASISCSSGSSCYYWNTPDPSWESIASVFSTTGGTSHSVILNTTNWRNQSYGIQVGCNDEDYNYVNAHRAFRINNTR